MHWITCIYFPTQIFFPFWTLKRSTSANPSARFFTAYPELGLPWQLGDPSHPDGLFPGNVIRLFLGDPECSQATRSAWCPRCPPAALKALWSALTWRTNQLVAMEEVQNEDQLENVMVCSGSFSPRRPRGATMSSFRTRKQTLIRDLCFFTRVFKQRALVLQEWRLQGQRG